MADKEAAGSKLDVSLMRTPIQISGKPIEQVLNSIHYGSPELRCLLMDECDLIFECKVCRALFRDLPNFISHKRAYCTKSALETRHVTIANLPEEKVVVIQPQAPEETSGELSSTSQQSKAPRPNLEQTILRIQSGELGRSHAYQVYTEAAEKLQRQKEGMKVATIRTTAIPTNKNAVFIDVNMTSVNIHERQQQVNNGIVSPYDQKRNDNSVTVIKRKPVERHSSTRNVRKSAKQERQSSEPQKLLMEQLKEIQHKVKQKVAAANDKTVQQKKVRSASQNSGSQKDTASTATTEGAQKAPTNTNTTRAQKKMAESSGLKVLSSDNVQSALANDEELKGNAKDEPDPEEVKYALGNHKAVCKIRSKAAKENKSFTAIAVTAAARRKKLSKRVPLCSKCNSVFATNKSLHFHEQIHHSSKRTFYPCPYCSSVFYYFFGITRHLFRNHSKSLDEINAMRRQLREKSFTKPLSTPLFTKEVSGSTPGSGRSTRSLGRIQLLNMSQDTPSSVDTSTLNDKQLSKKTSGDCDNVVPEASSKIARQKITKGNITQGEHINSPESSGSKISDKTEEFVNAKSEQEDRGETRPIRLKNRQQQRAGENIVKPSSSNSLFSASLRASTPVPSSPIISRSQDSMSHLCPKCHRAFRRKISCKNHIKVCKAKISNTLKPVRTPNTRLQSQQLTPETTVSANSNKNANMKNKNKTSSFDSTVQVTTTSGNQVTSPVKVPEKKDRSVDTHQGESSDSLRKTSSRNSQASSVDRTSNLAQRSSSVDRVVTNDEPRNRSRERNSAARDERDSSVESTQSNMEGKSPRSRRNVLSRYAVPAQLSKSPLKLDTSVKSDLSNDGYDKFSSSQQADTSENISESGDTFLHNGKDSASGDYTDDDNLKIENTSADAPEGRNSSLPATPVKTRTGAYKSVIKDINEHTQDILHPAENDTKLGKDINDAITLSKATQLSPVSNRSPEKLQGSPPKSQYSPHKPSSKNTSPSANKLSDSADRSGTLPDMSLDSPKPEVLKVKGDNCENVVSASAAESELLNSGEDRPKAELDNTVIKQEEIKLDAVDSDSTQDTKKVVIMNAEVELDTSASDHKPAENNPNLQQNVKLDTENPDNKSTENNFCMQERVKLGTPDSEQQTSLQPLMETVSPVQYQGEDKLPGGLHVECGSKAVQEDKPLHFKKLEVISDEQAVSEIKNSGSSGIVKNTSGNSKNKDIKAHNLPTVAVISALSERPKRKRKVPSRNKGAEEMLSKIHNHNREAAPVKKTKLIPEIKVSESPKKKIRTENMQTDIFTVAELDKSAQHIKNEPETHVSKKRLDLKDESLEMECADDDSDEVFGKAKGRFVSNRMYVLEKCGSKKKRLKCYDQMKVYRMIDEDQLKCLECGESCSQVCNLRRHVIRQHLKWSRFKCKLCKFESYDRSECATHLIRGHKNRAITLRNVNQFILDLVKQGSHARSLKKNETIKVKQQSESQEGNIYARPTVKKMLRLSQRAEDETPSKSTMDEDSGNRDIKTANRQPQVWTVEELVPAPNPSEGTVLTPAVAIVPKKQINTFTSSPKVESQSKQPTQQQISSKVGFDQSAAGKTIRKALPFNISTRNSPRTFDTRPYHPVSDDAPAEAETIVSKHKLQPLTRKVNIHEETLSKLSPKLGARSNGSLEKNVTKSGSGFVSTASADSSSPSTYNVPKSRNIFDNVKPQTSSSPPTAVSSSVNTSTTMSKAVSSSSRDLTVSTSIANQIASPRIIEVKVESPKNIVSVSSSTVLNQKLDPPHKKAANVKIDKAKIVSYVFRGPQQNVSNDMVNSDQLAKSLIKLEFGDQVSVSGASVSPSQQITKINLPPGKLTSAQIIDGANLQRKHTSIPASSSGTAKVMPVDSLKATQRSAGTSKETVGSTSGLSLAAALTKGGHIFTTVATSFIVNHGQAGKFIVYTRPAGAKDSTAVSSVTKQSPVPSLLSSTSSAIVTDVKTSDTNIQTVSQSPGAAVEDVLLPGTFVIRKHYL